VWSLTSGAEEGAVPAIICRPSALLIAYISTLPFLDGSSTNLPSRHLPSEIGITYRIIEIRFWKHRKLVRTVKVIAANMSLAIADRIRGCMAVYVPQGHAIGCSVCSSHIYEDPTQAVCRSPAGHLLSSSHIDVRPPLVGLR
jgi:hypothetical protein